MIRIELTAAEYDWTDANVGMKRDANAIEQNRKQKGGEPDDPAEARWKHILGARCEAAAYKWLKPVSWSWRHLGREHVPDLHDFIDVKGVDKATHNLMVKPDDHEGWAYLLVDGTCHPFYDIVGWAWGVNAKSQPLEERKAGRPTHFVDRGTDLMRDPHILELVLRERQEFPERAIELAARPG